MFLYTDEQRYDTLAAYGNSKIHMPNLNKLSQTSTVFEKTYVTQAVCTPSRSSLLTGLYPHKTGCYTNNKHLHSHVKCFPELLKDTDYRCAHFGKWHLGDEIFSQHGFHDWVSTEDSYQDYYTSGRPQMARSNYHHFLLENGIQPEENKITQLIGRRFFRNQLMNLPEHLSRPAFLAHEASRFIKQHPSNPWVLYVNFLEPHMPFHSCRDSQYKPEDVTLPSNFMQSLGPGATIKAKINAKRYRTQGYEGDILQTEQDWKQLTARYWGLCSLIDTHIGHILNTLYDTQQEENTIIVLTSDHGDQMGSHGLLAKSCQYEESIRVPLMIRIPGQRQGQIIQENVSHIDLVPTLLDLMNSSNNETLDGISLKPTLETGAAPQSKNCFIQWNVDKEKKATDTELELGAEFGTPKEIQASMTDEIRTVVTQEGWKLNWSASGEHQLYHLKQDPVEKFNLLRETSNSGINPQAKAKELSDLITDYQEKVNDPLELAEI